MPIQKNGPEPEPGTAPIKTATISHRQEADGQNQFNPVADEIVADLRRIKAANGDLFTALLNGAWRLSVPCQVCRRALTSPKSKAAGMGPSCAARAVNR